MKTISNNLAFKKQVTESTRLTVVQFTEEWNGACQIMNPIFKELSASYAGDADFFMVPVEENRLLENELGIMELPTILLYKAGEVVDHQIGLASKNSLITKIENALSSDNY